MHSVGIDFGTTKTLVARWDKTVSMAVTARLGNGRDAVPSSVYIESGGRICFAEAAEERLDADIALAPMKRTGRYIRGFKMHMGAGVPEHIVITDGDDDLRNIFAEDLVRDYLKYIRETTEKMVYMGEPVTKAVITRPVKFSPVQCENLKQSALQAGFKEVEFTTEPEAAGMAFCARNAAEAFRRSALIIDWGGGTLDLAWVTRETTPAGERICTNPRFTDGVANMAGELFDELLLNDVKSELSHRGIHDVEDVMLLPRVRTIKERLSSNSEAMLYVATATGATEPIRVVRERFNALISEAVDKAVEKVKTLLERIPDKDKPELLLLVGGSSRIPYIRERLEQACGLPAKAWQFSQEAVALGAAQYLVGLIATEPEDAERAPRKRKIFWPVLFLLMVITLGLLPLVYPLQDAIHNGHAAYARCLMMLGADVNRVDENGDSLLHVAVRNADAQCVNLLVEHPDAAINTENEEGKTPMQLAGDLRYTEIQQQISAALDNRGIDWQKPIAVTQPAPEKQTATVAKPAFIPEPVLPEFTEPEEPAVSLPDTTDVAEAARIAKLEQEQAARKAEEARLAKQEQEQAARKASYFAAAESGDVATLKRCLTAGDVTVDSVNANGQTALYLAVVNGRDDVVAELLRQGAATSARVNGKTYRTLAREQDKTACLRLLALQECEAQGMTANTCTAQTEQALQKEDAARLQLLADAYAPELKEMRLGKNRKTVLYMAIKGAVEDAGADASRAELLRVLLAAGINMGNCADTEWSPLHVAASYNYTQCLAVLLESPFALDKLEQASSTPNTTALWLAAEKGNAAAVELLLAQGAVNGKKARGKTPYEIASERADMARRHKMPDALKRYQRCMELLK